MSGLFAAAWFDLITTPEKYADEGIETNPSRHTFATPPETVNRVVSEAMYLVLTVNVVDAFFIR
jgi:hypothetical protein